MGFLDTRPKKLRSERRQLSSCASLARLLKRKYLEPNEVSEYAAVSKLQAAKTKAQNQDKGLSLESPDILVEFILDLVAQKLDRLIPV